jgi:hypothetical protein
MRVDLVGDGAGQRQQTGGHRTGRLGELGELAGYGVLQIRPEAKAIARPGEIPMQDSRDAAYDGALPFRRRRRRIGDGSAFDLCGDLARRAAAHPVERGIAGEILKSKD